MCAVMPGTEVSGQERRRHHPARAQGVVGGFGSVCSMRRNHFAKGGSPQLASTGARSPCDTEALKAFEAAANQSLSAFHRNEIANVSFQKLL